MWLVLLFFPWLPEILGVWPQYTVPSAPILNKFTGIAYSLLRKYRINTVNIHITIRMDFPGNMILYMYTAEKRDVLHPYTHCREEGYIGNTSSTTERFPENGDYAEGANDGRTLPRGSKLPFSQQCIFLLVFSLIYKPTWDMADSSFYIAALCGQAGRREGGKINSFSWLYYYI